MSFPRNIALAAIGLAMLACSDSPSGPNTPTIPDAATLIAEMSSSTCGEFGLSSEASSAACVDGRGRLIANAVRSRSC